MIVCSARGDELSPGEKTRILARATAPSSHPVTARCARAAGDRRCPGDPLFPRADDASCATDVELRRGAVPGHLHSVALRASLAMRACDEFLFVAFEFHSAISQAKTIHLCALV